MFRTVRRFRLSVAVLVTAATAMTGSLHVSAAVAADTDSSGAGAEESSERRATANVLDLEREQPDAQSAAAVAAELGYRVEDVSERDATTQVFANPDGTWTVESAPGPVRALDESGSWEPIETTLVAVDGGFAPANALGGLVISGGGSDPFASMQARGRETQWEWPNQLPTPTVDGSVATFTDAVDGGDLVVTATASGFRYDVVLTQQPTGPVEIPVTINTETGSSVVEDAGTVEVIGSKGQELITSSPPIMYDASQQDPDGVVEELPVEMSVEKVSATSSVVTLVPDQDFLVDPQTTYPVTVDPTYSSYVDRDTYVGSGDPESRYPGSETLKVGGGIDNRYYRTYLQFPNGPWMDAEVSSATLLLRNHTSLTCNGSEVRVNRVTEPYINSELRWKSQPAFTTSGGVRSSQAYGASGCTTPQDMTWNLTAIVQSWASRAQPNHGLRISAVDETARSGYREFRSEEYNTNQSAWPRLAVTYSNLSHPVGPNIEGCTSDGCDDSYPVIETDQPEFSTFVKATTAPSLTYTWEVRELGSRRSVAVMSSVGQANTTSSWVLPGGMLRNSLHYEVSVRASDPVNSQTTVSAWKIFATAFPEDEGALTDSDDPVGVDVEQIEDSDTDALSGVRLSGDEYQWRADGGVASAELPLYMKHGSALARAGDPIPYSGWAACPAAMTSEPKKIVKSYYRGNIAPEMAGSKAFLNCGLHDVKGLTSYGFRHIRARHEAEFQNLASVVGRQWRDVAGYMMGWSLKDPNRVTYRSGKSARFCHIRKFTLVNQRNEDVGVSTRVVVLTGATGRRIMTAFPTTNVNWCVSRLPSTRIIK